MSCGRVRVNDKGEIEVLAENGTLSVFVPVADELAFEQTTPYGPVRMGKYALAMLHEHLRQGMKR